MDKAKALDILKKAILLEMKGKSFYEGVARDTQHEGIRNVFETMAVEEGDHIEILSRQFKSLGRSGVFEAVTLEESPKDFSGDILTKGIRKEINAAGYEAAAIAAAMSMEERAVKFYSDQASTSDDSMVKEIYQWLADWEKSHLNLLVTLDRELQEEVWNDQSFWPF